MTVAERIVYERIHGRGSAPAPQPHDPETIEGLRADVDSRMQDLTQQQIDVEARRLRVEEEERQINNLQQSMAEAECSPVSNSSLGQNSASHRQSGQMHRTSSGIQRCVTPVYAIKRFFTDWMPEDRSSRSEVWWVWLFVQLPLLMLEQVVGNSELLILVGIIELILVWPLACLEGRRFHDLGHKACWGMGLVILRVGCAALCEVYGKGTGWALLGGIAGFILLLANVAQSQPHGNRYGQVPNA